MTNALILARNLDKIIGVDGMIPWHCPEDMKHFKAVTMRYKYMIMGHSTYKSLPKLLPDRIHIVLTTQPIALEAGKTSPYVYFVGLDDVYRLLDTEQSCIVIGGAEVAELLIDCVDEIFLTTIKSRINTPVDKLKVAKFEYNPYREFRKISTQPVKGATIEHFVRR